MGGPESMNNRRGQLKAALTRFGNYLQNEEIDPMEVKARREKIEDVYSEFEQVQSAIEMEKDSNVETQSKYRTEFENLYFKNVTIADKIIMSMTKNSTPDNEVLIQNESTNNQYNTDNSNRVMSAVKLAAINVPTFSGNYYEWASFYDIFSALIDSNITLTSVQKFFYLRSSLSGDALNTVKCLETTANNYKIAWSSLIKRYSNKKMLVKSHVKAIYELQIVGGESAAKLRQFLDALNGHMRALEALGQQPNNWGPLLMHLIAIKLDKNTLREWETKSVGDEIPLISELMMFLESRFKILESTENAKMINVRGVEFTSSTSRKPLEKRGFSQSFVTTLQLKCYVCRLPHTIYKCPTFYGLTVSERVKRVTELELCKICLRRHENKKCNARFCFKCAKPHNTLLHLTSDKNKSTSGDPKTIAQLSVENVSSKNEGVENSESISAHASLVPDEKILLSTAIVLLRDKWGNFVPGRVLLDSGSQSNLITKEMVQILKLKNKHVAHKLYGIGNNCQQISSMVNAIIVSKHTNFTLSASCLVVTRITNNIPAKVIKGNFSIPNNINLADPSFRTPQKIDLLIGAGYFFDLLRTGRLKPVADGPVFQETCLGWVVAGSVHKFEQSHGEQSSSNVCFSTNENQETKLENAIAKFWRLEEYEAKTVLTSEEKACKIYFNKNYKRDSNGRFVVHLPFKDDVSKLGNSYDIAKRRFLLLEKRFQREPQLKTEYSKFMTEYEELGHMECVKEDVLNEGRKVYYIPHHAVRNENSSTTKLRVVFDASCKTDTGVSLNDILLKGPVIQEELLYILVRFRTYNYVLSADIAKMYRQILVTEGHRDFQRVLWRADPTQSIKKYRLNTLTYGTVPASFLATACLENLAETEYNNFPNACLSILRDFYMDDYLGGTMYKADAIRLRDNIMTIMKSAGLELRKWKSNDKELIADLPSDIGTIHTMGNEYTKILGLNWKSDDDVLLYTVRPVNDNVRITKRKILSEIATVFDPLGLLGPVVIVAKLIMQNLWHTKVGWDENLPEVIGKKWQKYRKELPLLNNLIIPRKIIGNDKIVEFQVHGFSDASIKAYGACLYLRSTDIYGKHTVKLICAKSKVAPLKVVSLPRLELCAALLLSRLAHRVIPKLDLNINQRKFWSDSCVVLAWIAAPSTKWKTFVAHRIGEIQELTLISEWAHVSTNDNPADIISRGCGAEVLSEYVMWWDGPKWLKHNIENWPNKEMIVNFDIKGLPEAKTNAESEAYSFVCATYSEYPLLSKISSLRKIVRITAYCFRWRNNGLRRFNCIYGPLKVIEIENANMALIKMVQQNYFGKEIIDLKSSKAQVAPNSKLFRLRPFCDENNVLRVGGRLKNAADLDIFQKNPIILPGESEYTRLLFKQEHIDLLHSGPQALLASIRQKYWPLKARHIARNIVQRCVSCFKLKPIIVQPIMGDLPRDRVTCSRPFSKCGVDFAGPIWIKTSLRRKALCTKGYISLFVCFTTKAVHIELVSDLSTKSFLHALNRFFDRRGRSETIYSDNATNFVGANRQLRELYQLFQAKEHQDAVSTELANKGIQWKFIPPRSPHFGGLWEAAVKSMKNLLYRVLGEARLTFEEMNTVLTRVEACLNSRPITSTSSDPSDLSFLTPGHFLIGDAITAVPEREETAAADNHLDRWRRVTKYSQILWKRWTTEYLSQLQERSKWARSKGPSIGVGTVVQIRDSNLPPLKWRLGRVVAVHVGGDGVIRSASICTANGEVQRGVRLLCPLPFEGNERGLEQSVREKREKI